MVRALLELGAQPDRRDANRATALSLAARRGYIEIVDILLAGGADPNRVAQDNEVPLIVPRGLASIKSLARFWRRCRSGRNRQHRAHGQRLGHNYAFATSVAGPGQSRGAR